MFHSKAVETAVGIFIAIGLAAVLVLAMKVSNFSTLSLGNDKAYRILAKFDNIGGLKVKSPVKMAGVTVGRVTAVELDDNAYEAVAVLSIESKFGKIPTDTTANIYTAGLLGEQYISLEAGAEEEYLKAGGEITMTQSAVVLEQVIGQFLYDKAAGEGG